MFTPSGLSDTPEAFTTSVPPVPRGTEGGSVRPVVAFPAQPAEDSGSEEDARFSHVPHLRREGRRAASCPWMASRARHTRHVHWRLTLLTLPGG